MQVIVGGAAGGQVTLPVAAAGATFSRQSGLQLSVDSSWPGQYGYRPIDVTVRCQGRTTADKTIVFQFRAGDWQSQGKSIAVDQAIVLTKGSTTASARIIVPQYENWSLCSWDTIVDGRRDDELTVSRIDFVSFLSRGNSGMGALGTLLSDSQRLAIENELQMAYSGNNFSMRSLAPGDLPTDWLEYTSLDLFILPADQFSQLVQRHPRQAAAVMRWVRSGGNLWLIEAGSRWQELAAAERTLASLESAVRRRAATAPGEQSSVDSEDLPAPWRYAPLGERATESSEGALVLSGFELNETKPSILPPLQVQSLPEMGSMLEEMVLRTRGMAATSQRWFAVRGWGLGAITAFRGDLQRGGAAEGNQLFSAVSLSLLAPRISWPMRHGNQPDEASLEFNDLLIPDVGVAPVGQFQFLITVFVLAIGPLNYWFFKRRNRLPMLLATVPAAAVVTTLLLFAYGMLADGFGVRLRARSVTLLDQRAGEVVSWGRLSYYAGIAPRSGLTVPRDQAMYPISPNWRTSLGFGGRRNTTQRTIVWDGKQRLISGWLASRTPTQYHAIAARASAKRLDLRSTAEGLRVVNRLGSDVTHLAVHAHDGKFYWCEALADGVGRVLSPTKQTEIVGRVRRLFTENLPESPVGDDARYGSYYGFSLTQSLMEGRLEAINSPQVLGWGPGRYIAFTRQAIELDPGLADVTETSSFHVVEGRW